MRLPPLNAFRTFEAAARLGGFAAAAEELLVTPAAVSQQIKTLEGQLGVALFRRLPRGLELTAAAKELLPQVSAGLAHFERGIGRLGGGELAGPLVVTAPPSLASLWLVPRLGSFADQYPDIQLQVGSREVPPDLNAGEADIRITYGMGNYPGLKVQQIMPDMIFPVCAPSLLNRQPLRRFADLRNFRLLEDVRIDAAEPGMTWARWLRDEGVEPPPRTGFLEFTNSILLIQAAVAGLGVGLGRMSLAWEHLDRGTLVRPFAAERVADYAYYAVTTEAGAERRRVRVFLEWLFAEAGKEPRRG